MRYIKVEQFPVLGNRKTPYWNSTSSLILTLFIVICISFCINMPNFIQIDPHLAELWRHIIFKMAASSHIGFDLVMLDHPRYVIVGLSLVLKFCLDPIYSFGDIAIFTALHGMQSRYSDGNSVCPSVRQSVCPSVRLSNACIVTKRKKAMFRFLYRVKEHLS